MRFCWIAAAAIALTGTAQANEVGGWNILELDDACAMTMEYEGKGETEVGFFYGTDGDYLMTVANAGWTPTAGNTYRLAVAVDDTVWGPGDALALKNGSKPTLALQFAATTDFEPAFRSGSSLSIYLDDKLIDQLSLKGTGAAGAATRRCSDRLASRLAAEVRETARFDHLPDNPFAGATETNPLEKSRAARLVNAGFDYTDYPSAAIRNEEQGTTVVRVTVGTNGRASACTVAKSSGSSTLDSATCRLVASRSRFNPATDANGTTVEQALSVPMVWSIPR